MLRKNSVFKTVSLLNGLLHGHGITLVAGSQQNASSEPLTGQSHIQAKTESLVSERGSLSEFIR